MQPEERNSSQFIPSGVFSNFQSMLPALEQSALQTGNLVAPELSEPWDTAHEGKTSLPVPLV